MNSGIYRLIEYTSYNLQYDTTGNKIEWYCITKMRTPSLAVSVCTSNMYASNIMGKENFIPDHVFPLHNNAKLLTTESMIY